MSIRNPYERTETVAVHSRYPSEEAGPVRSRAVETFDAEGHVISAEEKAEWKRYLAVVDPEDGRTPFERLRDCFAKV